MPGQTDNTTTPRARAFTLIELLVVISIVVLLMALLFPALSRARKQARAAACQSQLHQWGLIFAVYAHDNDNPSLMPIPWWNGHEGGTPGLVLCPSATKPLPGEPVGWGDAFHAYSRTRAYRLPWSSNLAFALGSYGLNEWIGAAVHVPLMFDSASLTAEPDHHCPPPQHEAYDPQCMMSPLCIDRHHGGINMLFMDFSVRKVGLKELWTLKWHRQFDTTGPWTQAGGVLPEDWPAWMRHFRDY
jgi:prepilin-type N-terminal cleavage/methylation domain-containing protein